MTRVWVLEKVAIFVLFLPHAVVLLEFVQVNVRLVYFTPEAFLFEKRECGGAVLDLIGTNHAYMEFYPDGVSAGRTF